MDFKTHWIVDNFYKDASVMRKKIDEHFTESMAKALPFESRAIWNYWHIPQLYTYLRARPRFVMGETHRPFIIQLRQYAAKQFGLMIPSVPFLSMYINGCGQNIHNDARNGRIAYVFSLTKWQERHFSGGETLIYKLGDTHHHTYFNPNAGSGFYNAVEPVFNRLVLFDDRMPHAVNPIMGTMNPHDARFVMHGHMEEPSTVPYVEGGLMETDLTAAFIALRAEIAKIFISHGHHGFITWDVQIEPSGITASTAIKHMQLMPLSKSSSEVPLSIDDAIDVVAQYIWPSAQTPSRLVFAISSGSLRE
jgi:hypothetical protein